uniref:Ovule protein n=1 Tax=Steinernema glaseri TaxID=37863 RepID=A0A1I8AI01_9BILA
MVMFPGRLDHISNNDTSTTSLRPIVILVRVLHIFNLQGSYLPEFLSCCPQGVLQRTNRNPYYQCDAIRHKAEKIFIR